MILLAWLFNLASASATPSIVGTWQLETFWRITPEGKEIAWCPGAHGLLQYNPDHYMSASINCAPNAPDDAPSAAYQHRLLYAGTYRVEAPRVIHHVLNSSDLTLLGQDMVREVSSLKDGRLTLTGQSANHRGAFRIVGKKVPARAR